MATLVEIVPYDPSWPRHFSGAEAALRELLGSTVLTIDHVGSTAIVGMPAKPIIDIDVTLSSLTAVPDAGACLVEAGYEPRGNRYDDDVWAFMLESAVPQLRVYLCPPLNRIHAHRLTFRNHLRRHEDAAKAYAELKRQLAVRHPYDGDRYTEAKSEFILKIIDRALSQAS